MLKWTALRPREYAEVMVSWRTPCPRLSIWEDACLTGLVACETGTGWVALSDAVRGVLAAAGRP